MNRIARNYHTYVLIALFLLFGYLSFRIIQPYFSYILIAFVVTYAFYPLYKKLNKKIKNKSATALLLAILIILMISVPTYLLSRELTKEFFVTYLLAKQLVITDFYTSTTCDNSGLVCTVGNAVAGVLNDPRFGTLLDTGLRKLQENSIQTASDLITGVPRFLIGAFIAFFTSFYLFIEGKPLAKRIIKALPFKKANRERVVKQVDDVFFAMIYGSIIIASIQGVAAFIGYLIFGVESPLMWALATTFMALLPFIGPALIWLPISLFKILNGWIHTDQQLIWTGIGLLIYGTLVISLIDNVFKPYVIGSRSNLHPVVVLLGIIGGVTAFGGIGILVGPLVLALFLSFIKIYEMERQ